MSSSVTLAVRLSSYVRKESLEKFKNPYNKGPIHNPMNLWWRVKNDIKVPDDTHFVLSYNLKKKTAIQVVF